MSRQASGQVWLYAILSTVGISVAPLLVLQFLPVEAGDASSRNLLKVLLSFAAGGLLGDAFLHLLPHASHSHGHGHAHEHEHDAHGHGHDHGGHGHDHSQELSVGVCVLAGIFFFLLVEKAVRAIKGEHGHSHGPAVKPKKEEKEGEKKDEKKGKSDGLVAPAHDHDEGIKVAGYLNLAADAAHNFTDGLAVGAAFLAGERLAMVTVFTVLLHEIPHEIGDFAVLVQSGCSKKKAMLLQLTTAIGALAGTVVGLLSGEMGSAAQWILPFTAGGFIYIATVSVIPELLEASSLWQSVKELLAMVLGVLTMVLIVFIE